MDVYANFAYCALTNDVSAADVVLPVDTTARVPDPALGDVWMTFDSTLALGQFEIVKVLSKTPGTLTVARGQEGSSPPTVVKSGTVLRGSITAAMLRRLRPPSRAQRSYVTGVLAPGVREFGLIDLGKSYRLMAITTDGPARVRLYDRTSKQAPDATRPIGQDPADDAGVMFDYVTTNSRLSAVLSPLVDGVDWDDPPDGLIPITVDNLETIVSRTIAVTLTYLRTE